MRKTKASAVISTFILCYIIWLWYTESFATQELITGVVVSFLVALFTARFLIHEDAFHLFKPKYLANLILYIFVFIKELIKANIDVAKRALNPKLPIKPGIVKVPTEMKSDYGLAMLANSITLTPGTITMDIAEENGKNFIYIHWIDVATTDSKKAGEAIKGTLENWVRRIWR